MTLRTPFDFPLDPPGADGEKMVSVADPLGSAAQGTYYLARRFDLTEGTYTVTVAADDAATLWIGTTQFDSRIVASPVLGSPVQLDIYVQQGQYRLDVILKNTPVDPTPCYFVLTIKRGNELVYASTKDGWLLDDVAISDADLPQPDDVRLKLPVFSVLPNWQDGVTERLSWMTDVLASETDAEQRRSVRRNARRQFEASFLRQQAQRNRLDAFFVGVGSSRFMLPLWHEQVKMTDGIDMEASGVILDNLAIREFRKGDLVFVNNGDPDDYDILEVGDVEATRFSWAFPPPRSWPVGTRIYPMRQACIHSQAPKISNITDSVSTAQVLFDLVEPYVIDASFGSTTNGEPLFDFPIDWANAMDVEFARKAYVIDNEASIPVVVDHGKYTTSTTSLFTRLYGHSTAYRLRQFLQAARGRSQKFMCPTFMSDVFPLDDIAAGSDLLIRDQGFRAAMSVPQPLRIQLAFQFRDGSPTLYRSITAAQPVNDGLKVIAEKLTLDSPLPAITLSDLKRISFLCETRFDQDQFEIHHRSSNQVVVDVALVLHQFTDKRTPQ